MDKPEYENEKKEYTLQEAVGELWDAYHPILPDRYFPCIVLRFAISYLDKIEVYAKENEIIEVIRDDVESKLEELPQTGWYHFPDCICLECEKMWGKTE